MRELFQNILTASFHGSVVILVVIALRLVLKKAPKKFICLLWLLAGLRLLMPFEIKSELSLQPEYTPAEQVAEVLMEKVPEETVVSPVSSERQEINALFATAPEEAMGILDESGNLFTRDQVTYTMPEQTVEMVEEPEMDWMAIVPYLWLGVACCFAVYSLYSYLRLKWQVREAIRIPGGWECEYIDTAFILGFIKPKIYIPMGMPENVRKHILAHERTHLEKGDHWFKMIGFLALALHWFNPLVWVAYILLCKDIEMACDERVVQFMELSERKEYSAALLTCSTNRAHFAACPVAFGEVSVKYRIKSVLNYRKPSFWISLVGVIAIIFVAVCLVTSPTDEGGGAAGETTLETEETVVSVSTVDEMLAAIEPNVVVELAPGTYNLTEAANYGQDSGSEYYKWDECYDGYQLLLNNVEGLTIRGSGKLVTTIETEPRYANVIALKDCVNVTLEDFTAGHTVNRGECSGGVVEVLDCKEMEGNRLGLYGCGTIGLRAQNSTDVRLKDSDIYECSSTAVTLMESHTVSISGCRMYDIGSESYGGYTFMDVYNSQNVTVENCELADSSLQYLAYLSNSRVELKNNLFRNNRPKEAAFCVFGPYVTLENNKFEGNTIRKWYNGDNVTNLTEEQMEALYGTEPEEKVETATQPQLEVHVSTVDELISAIAPNTKIVLDAEKYDLSTATGYGTSKGTYYYWEDIFDGPALVIQNVDNLSIESSDGNRTGHTIEAIPRYADVLTFKACSNITLSGFTAGHTREPGSCAGGVLEFRDSDNMTVDNCGLFGCGILGVYAEYCSDVTVKNCEIYECSQGGIQMRDTTGAVVENNILRDLDGSDMSFFSCKDVTVDGEVLIPAGTTSSAEITNPEQEGTETLDAFVRNFAQAYFYGDLEAVEDALSESYTGEVKTYSDEENPEVIVCWYEVTLEMWREAEAQGWYEVFYPFRANADVDIEDLPEIEYLPFKVVKENGEWKVTNIERITPDGF